MKSYKYLFEQLQRHVSKRIINDPLLHNKWDSKGLYANTNVPLDLINAPIHVKNLCIRLRNDPNKLYWITKQQYIEFLKLNRLDMFTISKCHLVDIEIVKSHPHLQWDFPALSRNPSISLQDMLNHPEFQWCKCWMTRNPTISQEYILANLDDFDKSESDTEIRDEDSDNAPSEENSDDNYREYTIYLDEYDSILSGFSFCDEDKWNYIYLTKTFDIDFILNNPQIPWCLHTLYRRSDFTYTRERYELLEKLKSTNSEDDFPSYITSQHFHTWELILDHLEIKWDWYDVLRDYTNVCWDTCIHNIIRDYGKINYQRLSTTRTPIPMNFWVNSIAKNAKWNYKGMSLYSKAINFNHVLATRHKPKIFKQWEWKLISAQYISLENLEKYPNLPWNIKDLKYKSHSIAQWLVIRDKYPSLKNHVTELLEERGYFSHTLTLEDIKKYINTVQFDWYYISRNRFLFQPTIDDKVEFFKRVHAKWVIVRAWRNAWFNPEYLVCKRRIEREVKAINARC